MAQQLPLYTQYVFNPFLVNPSMAGAAGRPEVNLLYRQQWTSVPNAPRTIQGDFQYPLASNMGVGLQVVNDKTILLNATSVMATYAYRVNLATDHVLGFGLSAGIFANRVDLTEVGASDLGDPALMSAKSNNSAVDGQFGIHYRFKGFMLGASMVNLFDRKTITPDAFQKTKLSQLKNDVIFASYRFNIVPEQFAFQPNVAYRMHTNSDLNYYEASAVFSYKTILDVGGGYRQDFGPTGMIRVTFRDFSAGFAYDFPSPTAQVSTGGTREIQFKWRFGKDAPPMVSSKKNSNPVVATTTPVENTTQPPKQEESTTPKQEEKTPVETKKEAEPQPQQQQPQQQEPPQQVVETRKEPEPEVVKPEVKEVVTPVVEEEAPAPKPVPMLLIAGTYKTRANAESFLQTLKEKKLRGEIIETTNKDGEKVWQVHLPDFKTMDTPTLEKLLELQKTTGIPDAWYKKENE
jgi:type IX secretion system PorP/SprF family membrane protein